MLTEKSMPVERFSSQHHKEVMAALEIGSATPISGKIRMGARLPAYRIRRVVYTLSITTMTLASTVVVHMLVAPS